MEYWGIQHEKHSEAYKHQEASTYYPVVRSDMAETEMIENALYWATLQTTIKSKTSLLSI